MNNIFKHLVADEVGTSAFLATILDPAFDHPVFCEARSAIAQLLDEKGLRLTSPAPTLVDPEYFNIDIVTLWSGWTILIENKISSASVTRGQLNEYYSGCLLQLERNAFLNDVDPPVSMQPVCMIYLTPTVSVGGIEFRSLDLMSTRGDKKIHIGWNEILTRLLPICEDQDDVPSQFFRFGLEQINHVLASASRTSLQDDETRELLKISLSEIRMRLQLDALFDGVVFQRWSDQFKEQLFFSTHARSSYLGIYISHAGSDFPSVSTIAAVGEIGFEIAAKYRAKLRHTIAERSIAAWAEALAVPEHEIALDKHKGKIFWRFGLAEMSLTNFHDDMAEKLIRFTTVFWPTFSKSCE
ncbi:MAG: hypothetical protein EOP06_02650 [Proteobacteria bacterium]|jgi:hypothetical protein|nr:MAG: hypothetical protein EOP06_02650 [Pseudomonadota bacterium]